jgi:hypothetical protein
MKEMPFEHNCNKTTCDHQPTAEDTADEWNLNFKIDLENLQCLNEETDGSAKKIFRNWDERLSREHVNLKLLNIRVNSNFEQINCISLLKVMPTKSFYSTYRKFILFRKCFILLKFKTNLF